MAVTAALLSSDPGSEYNQVGEEGDRDPGSEYNQLGEEGDCDPGSKNNQVGVFWY